jgi:hypothetical protein
MFLNLYCLKYIEENTTDLMICEMPEGIARYNPRTKCDLLLGPCCCGAWHKIEEVYDDERLVLDESN